MEDIKKLVADLVANQSAVSEEKKVITKGLIEVSSMLDEYAKRMEELEQFQQQISSIASSSQKAQLVNTSRTYLKAIDVDDPQKTLEQAKKKPRILMKKPVVILTNKEKEKTASNQEPMKTILQVAKKDVLAFRKLVDDRTSKKCTETLNPSTVKPIPKVTTIVIIL
ncbi:hypothetical protein DSO57_1004970 [Entomophthora muscae]|uniref:Uncharacterized protein n=1 Tax=Entomophthora muscae TaxID=34485 RepID=A0ACC2U6L9_9FUNG|nr:hypothetical protein DSO57_1004970 [Entomophthora muscae]